MSKDFFDDYRKGYFDSEEVEIPRKPGYGSADDLRADLEPLRGKKYQLDCGHHVTLGYFLGNNIIIHNGKVMKIICTDCGY